MAETETQKLQSRRKQAKGSAWPRHMETPDMAKVGTLCQRKSWGTVREDYSASGAAWDFLSHDMARSKAYRWGEDGIAAICDRYQILVFGLAFWNEKDPILKERAFGLTPSEGNHGEDVKEYYFYLDNTPTHSYMKYLYKYPQARYPYEWLVEENKRRGGRGFEFELLDTGIFDEDRYFDIQVEYAKGLRRGHLHSHRGLQPRSGSRSASPDPAVVVSEYVVLGRCAGTGTVDSDGLSLQGCGLPCSGRQHERRRRPTCLSLIDWASVIYTANRAVRRCSRTTKRTVSALYGVPNERPFCKDGFHRAIVNNDVAAVNPTG